MLRGEQDGVEAAFGEKSLEGFLRVETVDRKPVDRDVVLAFGVVDEPDDLVMGGVLEPDDRGHGFVRGPVDVDFHLAALVTVPVLERVVGQDHHDADAEEEEEGQEEISEHLDVDRPGEPESEDDENAQDDDLAEGCQGEGDGILDAQVADDDPVGAGDPEQDGGRHDRYPHVGQEIGSGVKLGVRKKIDRQDNEDGRDGRQQDIREINNLRIQIFFFQQRKIEFSKHAIGL